ncbi:MAG: ribosome biogenesis factor YjgA, partial [Gammaproteobacteria bacterium]
MPRRRKDPDFNPDEFYGGPSKSQLKRDALELQELGAALEELPQDKVDAIEMGERLREALRELKRLKVGEARRRHMQFIGKLLRDEDPERFRSALT